MKKTYRKIALFLAVTLAAAAMSTAALAATKPEEGDAGITFQKGDPPTIIDPNIPGLSTSDIHFGQRELTMQNITYKSIENGLSDASSKYAGMSVANADPEVTEWGVTVRISEFKYAGDNEACMEGFILTLLKEGDVLGTGTTAPTVEESFGLTAGAAARRVLESAADGSVGKWGQNYRGELFVVGGTATEVGEAQATMTWAVQIGPSGE